MRRTAELGLLLAMALVLSYVESLIPFSFGIPGIKLGLSNLVVLLLLYEDTEGPGIENCVKKPARKPVKRPREEAGTPPIKIFPKGAREALLVNGMRIVLSGFLFSNLYAILYALAGAACSFLAMAVGRRAGRISMVGVSVLGGVFHNVGQVLVAMAVVETFAVAYYMPFLLVAGTVTGALLGIVGMTLLPHLQRLSQ